MGSVRMTSGKRKKIIGLTVICILSLVLLYALARVAMIMGEYRRTDELYEVVRRESFRAETPPQQSEPGAQPVEEPLEPMTEDEGIPVIEVDFQALWARNPDVVAWLWIPDTDISYPVLKGMSNDQYLRTSIDGTYSTAGCIFLDFRNSSNFMDRHSIIYGHNMRNGSMFGHLSRFADKDYFAEHQYLYIVTASQILQYRFFSEYIATMDWDSYRLSFEDDETFASYFRQLRYHSYQRTDWESDQYPPVLTLSTCASDYSTRRVIHAALIQVVDR